MARCTIGDLLVGVLNKFSDWCRGSVGHNGTRSDRSGRARGEDGGLRICDDDVLEQRTDGRQ